jgi:hypothetical protein
MAIGVWLHLTERHAHEHFHERPSTPTPTCTTSTISTRTRPIKPGICTSTITSMNQ